MRPYNLYFRDALTASLTILQIRIDLEHFRSKFPPAPPQPELPVKSLSSLLCHIPTTCSPHDSPNTYRFAPMPSWVLCYLLNITLCRSHSSLPPYPCHLDYGQSNLWKNQIHEMLGEKLVTDFWGQSREEYARVACCHQSSLGKSHEVEAVSLVFRNRRAKAGSQLQHNHHETFLFY